MENNEITFYLDSIAHAKIKNDQESFHMSPTESILIKRIIVNYYPKCNEEMKKLYDKIKSLMTVKMNQTFIGKMSWHITQYMAEKSINKSVVKKNKHKKDKLHFRINNNELELELILSRCPTDASRSEFIDYSLVIAPVVADLCTTPVALSAPPNSYQNNSQS